MHTPIILANWKMRLSMQASVDLAQEYKERLAPLIGHRSLIVMPSFFALREVQSIFNETDIMLGAQNCSTKPGFGPFTGEVSADQLKDMGVSSVLLGHSERRSLFFETIDQISQKVTNSLNAGLWTIMNISETAAVKADGRAKELLTHQLVGSLMGIHNNDCPVENLVVAYEPLWAISTSHEHQTPDPDYIGDIVKFIKKWVVNNCGAERAARLPVIYGGSVNEVNSHGFMEIDGIDGLLIGASSIEVDKMEKILS
ncbi:MAG: triose-phosphate isomerase family protein [Candidatus Dojkabacteria bacterium]